MPGRPSAATANDVWPGMGFCGDRETARQGHPACRQLAGSGPGDPGQTFVFHANSHFMSKNALGHPCSLTPKSFFRLFYILLPKRLDRRDQDSILTI